MVRVKANVGDVIQINEKFKSEDWVGCTMIVEEVRPWGVMAYLHIPMSGNAYLRIEHEKYDVIGKAVLVAGNDNS